MRVCVQLGCQWPYAGRRWLAPSIECQWVGASIRSRASKLVIVRGLLALKLFAEEIVHLLITRVGVILLEFIQVIIESIFTLVVGVSSDFIQPLFSFPFGMLDPCDPGCDKVLLNSLSQSCTIVNIRITRRVDVMCVCAIVRLLVGIDVAANILNSDGAIAEVFSFLCLLSSQSRCPGTHLINTLSWGISSSTS